MSENDNFISGEEYKAQSSRQKPQKKVTIPLNNLWVLVVIVILCLLSFYGGIVYQKNHTKSSAMLTASSAAGGIRGQGSFRRSGGIGQVTAVSSDSITIQNMRTNSSQTFTINSSTVIQDNGQTVTTSDIQNGETVIISTSGSGSTLATRINVNPSFGGGGGGSFGGQQQPASGTGGSTSAQ